MTRRALVTGAGALTLSLTVPALAGCGPSLNRSIASGPAPVPWRDGDRAEITFRHLPLSDASAAALTALTRAFERSHPGITVRLTTQAGTPGDGVSATLAQVDRSTAARLAASSRLVDLSGWAAASPVADGFQPGVRAAQQLEDGRTWLWPLTHSVLVQYRNPLLAPETVRAWRDMSSYVWAVGKKADESAEGMSRNEKAARTLRRGQAAFRIDPGDATRLGSGTVLLAIMAQSNGDPIFGVHARPTLDIAGVVTALKTLVRWSRNRGVSLVGSPTEPSGIESFTEANMAFGFTGVHERDTISAAVAGRFPLHVDPLPRGGDGQVNALLGHQVCVLASASDREQSAAWTYLDHLTRPEQQRALAVGGRTLPVSALTLDDPVADAAQRQLQIASTRPGVVWAGATELLLARAARQALLEDVPAEDALRAAQRDAIKAMDRR